MKNLLFIIIALLAFTIEANADNTQLRFKNGKFKIAQITDMHWGNSGSTKQERSDMISKLVKEEQPQLIILTGDNVTDAPDLATTKAEWQEVIDMLEATGVPYAIVMGNHDAETCEDMNADYLEQWLSEMGKNLLNYPTTSKCYGHGNKALEVLSENSDKVASVVYVIDSNAYPLNPDDKKYSDYDWIHPDQIAWYEAESEKYTAQNGGTPLPSLAYYHICVPEFDIVAADPNKFGNYGEPCCPGRVNTGFFGAAFLHRDIMGMFVGHDHSNDYCGLYCGIALCYGRQSGVEGNRGITKRGIRFVEINEGQRAFSTWVDSEDGKGTIWYYPTAFTSDMTFNANPAVNIGKTKNGVNYTYYEGPENENTAAMLVEKNKKSTGVMDNFDITKAPAEDHFGYDFDTYFMAEETGPYHFTMNSDDGSQLLIDGKVVIDNDGSHGSRTLTCNIGLAKGLHHFEVRYFEDYEGQYLKLTYSSNSTGEMQIPNRLLWIKK